MESRWCTACGSVFELRPQVPRQTYCSKPSCQSERRRLWQQVKRLTDPDYSENQSLAQSAWAIRNAQYWRNYREAHPEYVAKNRLQQKNRNSAGRKPKIAKSDVPIPHSLIEAGVYRLNVLVQPDLAKSGVWLVQLTLHESEESENSSVAKR
jgi:hypothetical protein